MQERPVVHLGLGASSSDDLARSLVVSLPRPRGLNAALVQLWPNGDAPWEQLRASINHPPFLLLQTFPNVWSTFADQ